MTQHCFVPINKVKVRRTSSPSHQSTNNGQEFLCTNLLRQIEWSVAPANRFGFNLSGMTKAFLVVAIYDLSLATCHIFFKGTPVCNRKLFHEGWRLD